MADPQPYSWRTPPMCLGINNTNPDSLIAPEELSDARNYQPDFTGQGWLIKREGLTKTDSNQRTGAATHVVFDGRNQNYYQNGSVLYTFAGTSVKTALAQAYGQMTSFGTYDILVNGTDAVKSSDGSSFSALSGIPSGAKFIAAANNFLYCAGHSSALGEVRYCDYGTAEDNWDATNSLILTNDENDVISGLCPVKNGLSVWCNKSFYIVSGWSDLEQEVAYYDKSDGHVGGPNAIVNTPYGIFFWSLAGMAVARPGYQIEYPMLRKLAKTLNGLNRAKDAFIHGVYDKVQQRVCYWLFNGTSQTTVNLRMDYYPALDAFFLHSGAGCNMSASGVVTVSGVQNIYVGGYNPTYLYKQSGAADDGTSITAYAESPREGSALVERNGRTIFVTTDQVSDATFSYSCYQDNASSATQSVTLSSVGTGLQEKHIKLNMQNKRIKHRIEDSSSVNTRVIGIEHAGEVLRII